jgi:hypothetical protein
MPAAGGVDRQHRRALAAGRIGDRTEGGLDHARAARQLPLDGPHVALPDQSDSANRISQRARNLIATPQASITAVTGRRSDRGIGGA